MALMWHAGQPSDGILWVEINWTERPVNALSRATLAELSQLLTDIRRDSAIRAVVFKSGKSANFIAGADVTEFQKLKTSDEAREFVELGQQVFDDLAALTIPTIALVSARASAADSSSRSPAATGLPTRAARHSWDCPR